MKETCMKLLNNGGEGISIEQTHHIVQEYAYKKSVKRSAVTKILPRIVTENDVGDDMHLTHLSQGVDYHLTQRDKQNKHVVGDKNDDVDNDFDNGVVECVDDGDDDSVAN
eukprot:6883146-Ditylum_brightwellii.AAC.1